MITKMIRSVEKRFPAPLRLALASFGCASIFLAVRLLIGQQEQPFVWSYLMMGVVVAFLVLLLCWLGKPSIPVTNKPESFFGWASIFVGLVLFGFHALETGEPLRILVLSILVGLLPAGIARLYKNPIGKKPFACWVGFGVLLFFWGSPGIALIKHNVEPHPSTNTHTVNVRQRSGPTIVTLTNTTAFTNVTITAHSSNTNIHTATNSIVVTNILSVPSTNLPIADGTYEIDIATKNDTTYDYIAGFIEWFGVLYGLIVAAILVEAWMNRQRITEKIDDEHDQVEQLQHTLSGLVARGTQQGQEPAKDANTMACEKVISDLRRWVTMYYLWVQTFFKIEAFAGNRKGKAQDQLPEEVRRILNSLFEKPAGGSTGDPPVPSNDPADGTGDSPALPVESGSNEVSGASTVENLQASSFERAGNLILQGLRTHIITAVGTEGLKDFEEKLFEHFDELVDARGDRLDSTKSKLDNHLMIFLLFVSVVWLVAFWLHILSIEVHVFASFCGAWATTGAAMGVFHMLGHYREHAVSKEMDTAEVYERLDYRYATGEAEFTKFLEASLKIDPSVPDFQPANGTSDPLEKEKNLLKLFGKVIAEPDAPVRKKLRELDLSQP